MNTNNDVKWRRFIVPKKLNAQFVTHHMSTYKDVYSTIFGNTINSGAIDCTDMFLTWT